MNRQTLTVICISGALFAFGCNKQEAPPEQKTEAVAQAPAAAAPAAAAPAAADPASAATKLFQSKCVVCHGSAGLGDGPGAAALTPKPRAFGDASWQAAVTDEQIGNTIVMGGAAVGKSPAMPPNPDLGDKADVVKELVKLVRAFKKG